MKLNNKTNKAKKYKLEQEKLRNDALKKGVNLIAPDTIFLSKDTKFGKNVTIEPYVVIGQKVKIGSNVTIKSFSYLEGAVIKNKVTIGPYTRLRPGAILEENSRVAVRTILATTTEQPADSVSVPQTGRHHVVIPVVHARI